jgi:hypothetical protein
MFGVQNGAALTQEPFGFIQYFLNQFHWFWSRPSMVSAAFVHPEHQSS